MSDIAVSVQNLTKTYRIFGHPGDRIKQALTFGRRPFHREFTALKDVSFDIRKGETVGIIGRNGSGKSTLLQLICGILKPTSGTVNVYGRISALLELGAGFNPEFTGRENVYFQGAVMGFSKPQMDARFEEIATFAGIGEFIDQPVRTYSSGMFVRLAFSVAISVEPDILVVDEALAVGDVGFQGRCLERVEAIRRSGGTVLLVTHSMEQVAHHCDRAILLDHGGVLANDVPASVLNRYVALLGGRSNELVLGGDGDFLRDHPAYNNNERRWGDGSACIEKVTLFQEGEENSGRFLPGYVIELRVRVAFFENVDKVVFGLAIKSVAGAMVLSINSRELACGRTFAWQAGDRTEFSFLFFPFFEEGAYTLSLGAVSEIDGGIVPHDRRYDLIAFCIEKPRGSDGNVDCRPRFVLHDER